MSDDERPGTHANLLALEELLRSRIADANRLLHEAEADMEYAVATLSPVLVGDKRMSSVALDRSFMKVKDAHKLVAELEGMLARALRPSV